MFSLVLTLSASTGLSAQGNVYPGGYLCCNMRSDGSWISDINYQGAGTVGVPVGTPVQVTGYERNRVNVLINGQKQTLGNDYSRNTPLPVFTKRYVVEQDPLIKIKTYPKKIQEAIASARLTKGMTQEQVVMAVGYPVTDENTNSDAKIWHFWLASNSKFSAIFDDQGILVAIETDFDTRFRVVLD